MSLKNFKLFIQKLFERYALYNDFLTVVIKSNYKASCFGGDHHHHHQGKFTSRANTARYTNCLSS